MDIDLFLKVHRLLYIYIYILSKDKVTQPTQNTVAEDIMGLVAVQLARRVFRDIMTL